MQSSSCSAPTTHNRPDVREIRIPGLRRVLRVSWSDDALRRDVADEIAFHVDARTEELVRLGASPADARARAEAEFGDVQHAQLELLRVDRRRAGHQRRGEIIMTLIDDLRYAARGLLRRPAILVITTLTLAIGIAANAIMFGIVDQLMLQPPVHVRAPESMRRIYLQHRDRESGALQHNTVTTFLALDALRKNVPALDVVIHSFVDKYSLGSGAEARQVEVQLVSGNYFSVLGVRPILGRALLPSDDAMPTGEQVAVVSEGFWRAQLGADSAVIGKVLHIDRAPYTIVGVAPAGFSGLDRLNTDMWVPLSAMAGTTAGPDWATKPNNWWLQAFARVKPGANEDATAQAATRAYRNEIISWNERHQDTTGNVVLGSIIGTRTPDGLSKESRVSLWLLGVSAIVLIIACANVANLLIARTFQRRREIAVRLALGVSRSRLLQLLLAEAALLAVAGAVLALFVAIGASRAVQNLLLPGIVWSDSVIDTRVLLLTLGATVLAILLAGLAPALQGMGTRVSENLKSAASGITARSRMRQVLLLVQATLSVVLLIGAGLFVRSLNKVVSRDVGIDLDQVLLVQANLGGAGFTEPQVEELFRQGAERVSTLPGVSHATLVRKMVPTATAGGISLEVAGVERIRFPGGGPYYGVVGADYFPTMGTTVLRGRNFLPSEDVSPNRSLIINKIVADAYFPGVDPLGRCARLGSDTVCSTIVGVVENMMLFQLIKDDRALLFVPLAHQTFGDRPVQAMVVRVDPRAGNLVATVQREMQALAPGMPFVTVEPFNQRVAKQLRPWRLGATIFTIFGVIALVIAAVGLYSVMAYWVTQRTHEIGVRMALGARRAEVVRLVAWQSSRPLIAGVLLGVGIAWFASRWVVDMLYETSPTDPMVYAIAAILLLVAGVAASVVPARRASAVDPARAIRVE
jgi:putative ABC transport system permease protein